jgi:hypothetical protein
MNDLREAAGSTTRHTGQQVSFYALALLILLAMLVWLGFLGWGLLAMLRQLLDFVQGC